MILKGLLAGGLVVGGIISPFGLLIQAILFFLGVFVFIDAIIPEGQASIVASFLSAVLGGVISLIAAVTGFSIPWIIVIVLATVVFYSIMFSKRRKT